MICRLKMPPQKKGGRVRVQGGAYAWRADMFPKARTSARVREQQGAYAYKNNECHFMSVKILLF